MFIGWGVAWRKTSGRSSAPPRAKETTATEPGPGHALATTPAGRATERFGGALLVETLKTAAGTTAATILYDSTVDECTNVGVFTKTEGKGDTALVAFTTDGDVFCGFHGDHIEEQDATAERGSFCFRPSPPEGSLRRRCATSSRTATFGRS